METQRVFNMQYTEADLIEIYEERAAIREYDGLMERRQAEQAAYFDWRKIVGNDVVVPDHIRKLAGKFRG